MNNATRFINSWLISAGDSELRMLILNEFSPFVSFMVESPKFPGIKVTAFKDMSAIIDHKKDYTITTDGVEFINAFLSIFRGDSHAVKRFFTECVSIIDSDRSGIPTEYINEN
jgi:hypothetical protein